MIKILLNNSYQDAEKEESNMQNPNKKVMEIDETPKGRKGIKEMLDRMSEMKDSSGDKRLTANQEPA